MQPETGGTELIVPLPHGRLNPLETSGSERAVLLRCEELGFSPHVHQDILPQVIEDLRGWA